MNSSQETPWWMSVNKVETQSVNFLDNDIHLYGAESILLVKIVTDLLAIGLLGLSI
jgi:hypothetical protein